MNICFIGIWDDFAVIDEGMKKTNFLLLREISENNNVLSLNIFNFFSYSFWNSIKKFNPDIIHYTCGGSFLSFFLLKIISIFFDAKTVITILQPHNYNSFLKFLILRIKSDILLTQTQLQNQFYRNLGLNSLFFPSGVDINKFKPVSNEMKIFLRDKYEISQHKFIILHVGHIKKGRNLKTLKKLLNKKNEVIVVGSPSLSDINEYNKLEKQGFRLLCDFIIDINEIYALSDCYIFPVYDETECISMPLSILEAMATNLPVITSKFGDLDKIFSEGDGLLFINDENQIKNFIDKINFNNINTRKKVLDYSWKKLGLQLIKIYNDLITEI